MVDLSETIKRLLVVFIDKIVVEKNSSSIHFFGKIQNDSNFEVQNKKNIIVVKIL